METIVNAKVSTGKKQSSIFWNKQTQTLMIETSENPEKGKANKEIIKKLKKFFDAQTEIVFGQKSREKKLRINLEKEKIIQKLSQEKLVL
jgi:uncharacterized protein (TIGR00251 family)